MSWVHFLMNPVIGGGPMFGIGALCSSGSNEVSVGGAIDGVMDGDVICGGWVYVGRSG